MSAHKGILFDFDGTLADTMEGHYLAWKAALGEHGISVEAGDYYPLEGRGLHEIARELAKGFPCADSVIDDMVQRKKAHFVNRRSMTFYPGVEALVSELKERNVPMAIVTAGHLDQLRSSVPERFLGHFDALVTGDVISRGKPDPEPYLRGAQSLGLAPEECIAIENAPLGVQSARSAHVYCIAVCSTVDRSELAQADEILERFEDLRDSAKIRRILEAREPRA